MATAWCRDAAMCSSDISDWIIECHHPRIGSSDVLIASSMTHSMIQSMIRCQMIRFDGPI
jgi:hypothetical protein